MVVPQYVCPWYVLRLGMSSSSLLATFSPGWSPGFSASCTAMLFFKMKTEGNLNHLLVATKRAGDAEGIESVALYLHSLQHWSVGTLCFSGDADSCGNKGLHSHSLCIY